jgi:hypothetical protein
MLVAEMIGTATISPTKPSSCPTITTPISTTAGCRLTARDITSGITTLPSICWTST